MTFVSFDNLVTAVKSGQVVSFPTDTVPALAAQPEQAAKIFAAKKRPPDKPLILLGSSFEQFIPYLQGTATDLAMWEEMVKKHLPGALTLVLPASEIVPRAMNPLKPGTIGIRIPELKLTRDILSQTQPLATTSANLSGEAPLLTMKAIEEAFPEVKVLDNGEIENPLGSGLPSTVAAWTQTGWQILRQGSVRLT